MEKERRVEGKLEVCGFRDKEKEKADKGEENEREGSGKGIRKSKWVTKNYGKEGERSKQGRGWERNGKGRDEEKFLVMKE